MAHIDKNSIKHFAVCFLLSLVGAYSISAAIGATDDASIRCVHYGTIQQH